MKTISRYREKVLFEELDHLKSKGIIDERTIEEIKGEYAVTERLEFINILILFSIALISIGIIGFASINWYKIPTYLKVSSLIILLIILLLGGLAFEKKNTIISRVLYCLSMVELFVSITLIMNIFGVSGREDILLRKSFIWLIALTPLVFVKKDKFMNTLYSIGIMVFISETRALSIRNTMDIAISLAFMALFIFINFYIVRSMKFEKIGFIFLNITIFSFLINILDFTLFNNRPYYLESETFITGNLRRASVYIPAFLFGLFLDKKYQYNKMISFEGNILHFISSILFLNNIYGIWYEGGKETSIAVHITSLVVFSGLYIAFLMTKVKKGSTVNIVFSSIILIIMYYRLSSEYMSKSTVFLGSGLILLLSALYIKRKGKISYGERNDSNE